MNLGEFEHIVLLAILRLGEDAYAIPIREEIEERTGRSVARGALYTALERLETKRCLRSRMSEPLPERGGRSRRYFTVTASRAGGDPQLQAEPAPPLAGPRRQARIMTHAAVRRRGSPSASSPPRSAAASGPNRSSATCTRSTPCARPARGCARRSGTGSTRCASPLAEWPRARARASLGALVTSHRPFHRHTPGDSLMRTLGLEMRHACRSILKRPAMSAIVVITLALGLGANAAVFSMIDALVLRPFTMPRRRSHHAAVRTRSPDDIDRREALSPADFLDLKRQQPMCSSGSRPSSGGRRTWSAQDEPENVQGFFVSADFFPALGVQPVIGPRLPPRRGDARPASPRRHRSRSVAAAIRVRPGDRRPGHRGRRGAVRGRRHRAAGLRLSDGRADLGAAVVRRRGGRQPPRRTTSPRIGRLAPGRTLEDAKAQMATIGERLAREYPDTNRGRERARLHARRRHDGHRPRADPVAVAGVGVFRAAHRVRERRQPAPGARRRAPARDGRAPGDRRQPRRASCASCSSRAVCWRSPRSPRRWPSRGSA